ncbi:MAG: hypothetical protein ACRETN_02950 [Nevskiales bacterium]
MPILEFSCRRRLLRASASLATALALAAAGLLSSGCETLQEVVAPEPPPASTGMLSLEQYLAYTRLLTAARPAQQKKVYQQAVSAYRRNPTPHNQLRYALTLSVLDSPYGDSEQAHKLFKALAATPLPRDLGALVNLQLHVLQHRRALTDRVAILSKALDDAAAKIDALTTIEQKLERPAREQDIIQR